MRPGRPRRLRRAADPHHLQGPGQGLAVGPLLQLAVEDRIAVVTLDRPERRNALNVALTRRIREVMSSLDGDGDVDVVVLTGSDPAFCAGVDLKEAGESGGGVLADLTQIPPRGLFDAMSKPVIGAINGPAATGGLELALTCDFLIASERAAFADTHARVGILPAGGATVRLARWIGLPRAKQMSLTGAYVRAEQALAWGLVTEVVEHERLLPRAREIAGEIAAAPSEVVRRIRDVYDRGAAVGEDEAWDIERSAATSFAAEGGYDPAMLEQRRAEVIARGSRQQ